MRECRPSAPRSPRLRPGWRCAPPPHARAAWGRPLERGRSWLADDRRFPRTRARRTLPPRVPPRPPLGCPRAPPPPTRTHLSLAQELELALNEITPAGAKAVAACVASKPALRSLNLRENELEDAGALALAGVRACVCWGATCGRGGGGGCESDVCVLLNALPTCRRSRANAWCCRGPSAAGPRRPHLPRDAGRVRQPAAAGRRRRARQGVLHGEAWAAAASAG